MMHPERTSLNLVRIRDNCAIELINESHIDKERVHLLIKFIDQRLLGFSHTVPIILNSYADSLAFQR
jgi:hypothetical protein